jgi:hypothetical protein
LKKLDAFAVCALLFIMSPLVSVMSEGNSHGDIIPSAVTHSGEDPSDQVCATNLAKAVYENVSLTSYRQFVVKLTENGSRYYGSDANTKAMSWLTQELVGLSSGKIGVSILGTYKSVVGKLPGYLGGDGPSIVIGGHYDSVPGAPGANDDGSGVAAVLELARVLSQYDWPLDIYFCLWNNEEQGLYGSREVSSMFLSWKIDVLVNFNVDMLLVQDYSLPPDQRVFMNYQVGIGTIPQDAEYWTELARCMGADFGTAIIHPVPSTSFQYWRQSDHYSFVQRGYKRNIFVFESGSANDNAYHTSQDTWSNPLYNYTVAASAVASIGASIAFTLSRTQGQLTYSKYTTDLSSGESRDYPFEMTMQTQVQVDGSWSGATGLRFSVLDPSSSELASNGTTDDSADNRIVLRLNTTTLGIHTLRVTNMGADPVSVDIVLAYDTDLEGNGIPDSKEFWRNAFDIDSDGDGVSNGEEMILGLDRFDPDTDNDGMRDGWEIVHGLNPLVDDSMQDPDEDGLKNLAEYKLGTNPVSNDTDGDGMPDGWESAYSLNPLVDDSREDLDHDGLTNFVEYSLGTNPGNNDTDADGMPDGWEVAHGLKPLVDDSQLDPDGDGLTNIVEYQTGHDPHVPDSAGFTPMPAILFAGIGSACALAFLAVVKISTRHQV